MDPDCPTEWVTPVPIQLPIHDVVTSLNSWSYTCLISVWCHVMQAPTIDTYYPGGGASTNWDHMDRSSIPVSGITTSSLEIIHSSAEHCKCPIQLLELSLKAAKGRSRDAVPVEASCEIRSDGRVLFMLIPQVRPAHKYTIPPGR
jgi:hypothetical protein